MSEFVSVKKTTGNDRLNLQTAIDKAVKENICTIVVERGEYLLDDCLLIPDYTHIILDGAKLKLSNNENQFIMRNSNSIKSYAKTIEAEQIGITITGINDAEIIDGTILFSNLNNSIVEGVKFSGSQDYGVVLVSTVGCRLRNLNFYNTNNGIAFGIGARDSIVTNVSGNVKNSFLVFSDELFRWMKKHYHTYDVTSNIIRGVNAKAKNIIHAFGYKNEVVGNQVERLIISDIKGEVSGFAFFVENGKHIIVDNVSVDGKLINDDVPECAVTITNKK